jgi:ABC-type lipoprotein release transport system permease subunit
LKIVGVVRSQGQLDNEVLVSLETANTLASDGDVSFIEFSFKNGVDRQEALAGLSALLPVDVEVVKVQQTAAFLQQSNGEILNFLSVWSLTVYFVVAAASYVVSTRLAVESEYELVTLKAIGVKRRRVFALFFSYTVVLALVGAFLGLAFGVVGTQVSSTVLGWFWQGVQVEPFLEPFQVGQILALSVVFSVVGCVYPAFKGTQRSL